MEALKSTLGNVYFYVYGETVYNVKPYIDENYNEDSNCILKGVETVTTPEKEAKVPYFVVWKDNKATTYYLYNYIENGDVFSATDQKFYKCPCIKGGGLTVTIQKWYTALCEEQIKNTIKGRPAVDFEFFNERKDLLGVPEFILDFEGSPYTVTGIEQIPFNEDSFKEIREEVIKSEVWNAINARANDFGYELTTKEEDLAIDELA